MNSSHDITLIPQEQALIMRLKSFRVPEMAHILEEQLKDPNADLNTFMERMTATGSTVIFQILFIAFAFFSGWHAGGKSIFLADAITDTAEFMITAFIGNILVMVNEAGSIEDDVVMNVIFVNMGTDYVFIFSFQHFICKLLS